MQTNEYQYKELSYSIPIDGDIEPEKLKALILGSGSSVRWHISPETADKLAAVGLNVSEHNAELERKMLAILETNIYSDDWVSNADKLTLSDKSWALRTRAKSYRELADEWDAEADKLEKGLTDANA